MTFQKAQKKVKASESVKFLGMKIDQKLTMKEHHKKQMSDAKRRIALFSAITGSNRKPRANSDICMKIFKSMIEPMFYYGTTVTCLKTKGMFKEQDDILRKGAKLAIHCPRSVRNWRTAACGTTTFTLPPYAHLPGQASWPQETITELVWVLTH